MAANLRQKDLLVVGFWSDWEYLNAVIGAALIDVQPLSVTVIDLSPTNALEQKAPQLWEIAHAENVTFEHVQESGAARSTSFVEPSHRTTCVRSWTLDEPPSSKLPEPTVTRRG